MSVDENFEHQRMRSEAERLTAQIAELESRIEEVRKQRVELMQQMRSAGFSWAAIGRCMSMSAPAVQYATGNSTRQKRTSVKADEG